MKSFLVISLLLLGQIPLLAEAQVDLSQESIKIPLIKVWECEETSRNSMTLYMLLINELGNEVYKKQARIYNGMNTNSNKKLCSDIALRLNSGVKL